MKSKILNIVIGILVVTVFWIYMFISDNKNKNKFNEDTYNLDFKGRISAKYIDKKDHNIPKIKIQCVVGKTIVYDLANDDSGLFEHAKVGDSIEKYPNSNNVRVCNPSKDTTFTLDF